MTLRHHRCRSIDLNSSTAHGVVVALGHDTQRVSHEEVRDRYFEGRQLHTTLLLTSSNDKGITGHRVVTVKCQIPSIANTTLGSSQIGRKRPSSTPSQTLRLRALLVVALRKSMLAPKHLLPGHCKDLVVSQKLLDEVPLRGFRLGGKIVRESATFRSLSVAPSQNRHSSAVSFLLATRLQEVRQKEG